MYIKFTLFLLCVLPFSLYTVDAPKGTPKTNVLSYQKDAGLEYWLYTEEGAATKEKPPLLIFLHGKGETTMASLLKWGPPKHAEAGKKFPGIVVAPLSPNGEWWRNDRLIVFVDSIAKKYNVDLRRIYITGLSMGGFGTWNLTTHYPGRFAAMVPICGGGKPELASAIKDTPCWVFHGSLDNVVKQKLSDDMVAALKEVGSDVKYTIYPNEAHACWIPAYADEEMYTWMYQQRRTKAADIDLHAALKFALKTGVTVTVDPRLLEKSELSITKKAMQVQWHNTTAYTAILTPNIDTGSVLSSNLDRSPIRIVAGKKHVLDFVLAGLNAETADYGLLNLEWTIVYVHDSITDKTFKQNYVFRITPVYGLKQQDIIVDGDLRDWSTDWISVDKAADILRADKKEVDTQCSYAFQVAYDKNYVYVGISVEDDVCFFNPRKNVWDQDGVEVRLDARPQAQRETYIEWKDFLPFLLSPQPEGGFTIWNQKRLPKGTQMDAQIRQGKYTVEMAIPISYVEERSGKDWKRIRLNVAVNDFDSEDKRGPQLWWYPDWRGSLDSRLEGTFERAP